MARKKVLGMCCSIAARADQVVRFTGIRWNHGIGIGWILLCFCVDSEREKMGIRIGQWKLSFQ